MTWFEAYALFGVPGMLLVLCVGVAGYARYSAAQHHPRLHPPVGE